MLKLEDFVPGDKWIDSDGDEHTIIGPFNGEIVTSFVDGNGQRIEAWPLEISPGKDFFVKKLARKHVRYLNIYRGDVGFDPDLRRSRAEADEAAVKHWQRIACVRIEFEEGQFDG